MLPGTNLFNKVDSDPYCSSVHTKYQPFEELNRIETLLSQEQVSHLFWRWKEQVVKQAVASSY